MGKYDGLEKYLENVQIKLSYAEIENIIGSEFPPSASTDRTWWRNTMNPTRKQAHAWLNAGWKVLKVDLGNNVTFVPQQKKDKL
ncbi:Uncharacterised protein [Paenibacillus polymyxa]|uniref:DUF7662 domain-containing protein n=1 Tax=Paenibacillus polymyxa TaxID=1406 RepID=UPI000D954763|nr:hypothetical protein [Paenibacillus polymyxa]SPY16110.1 Uncharacterised protein [Paenibacillus polymyxa]